MSGLLNRFRLGLANPAARRYLQTQAKELPVGKHSLQMYSLGTPNGKKASIFLEELGVPYDAWLIDITKGDQFTPGFVALNPNSKIPVLLDQDGPDGKPFSVFESGSILLYLAEKFDKEGKFLPQDPRLKHETITWLFFNIGAAPFFGQFGHFYKFVFLVSTSLISSFCQVCSSQS
jgi:GST-like protein